MIPIKQKFREPPYPRIMTLLGGHMRQNFFAHVDGGDIVSLTHNVSFRAQKLTHCVSFWAQKTLK
jgi:hypothetical protein